MIRAPRAIAAGPSAARRRLVPLAVAAISAGAVVLGPASPANAATYTFENVADSITDGFDAFSFGCAAINNRGQIGFRSGVPAPDGFNVVPGVYRANTDGSVAVIAENRSIYDFIGFNPSISDSGVVSFAAGIEGGAEDDFEAILVGGGGNRAGIVADTRGRFNFFGFDTSINNRLEVAFTAELDGDGAEGLFSGRRGGPVITHYLTTTSDFDGSDSRPSINNVGQIAFSESVDFREGIFVGRQGQFATVLPPSDEVGVSEPILNNAGLIAVERSFTDPQTDLFVSEIVTASPSGAVPTVVVDTRGPFREFGFRPPALNNAGQVAFLGTLDNNVQGIFVDSGPGAGRVIRVGDTLDGDEITGLRLCEEGLNDSGQLTFVADFLDPTTLEQRVSVYRATPG